MCKNSKRELPLTNVIQNISFETAPLCLSTYDLLILSDMVLAT